MNFKSRFKGKMTIMNKEGVIGIVNQPSIPISKDNQFFTSKNELSPFLQKNCVNTEGIRQTKSYIFTNIQTPSDHSNYIDYTQKISNSGKQIIKQNHIKTEHHHYYLDDSNKITNQLYLKMQQDFNQLNLDEYEIIAIPKTILGQIRQQLNYEKQRQAKSYSPTQKKIAQLTQILPQITTQCTSNNQTPLLKKQNTYDQIIQSQFNKQSSEKLHKRNQIIQQVGIRTLRYKSFYSKR